MQKINQLTANPLQSGATEKPPKYRPTPRQAQLVSALWVRMRQLFGHKWTTQAGPAKLGNGEFSPEFLLWCRKLERLSDSGFQRGFKQLEHKCRESARIGEEEWPPSYAGFLGYCEKHHEAMAHKRFKQPQLPDKTAQDKARAVGARELDNLKNLFD